ncbi:hypothetical protein GA0070622_0578 [Micromonospora sediminicola]|uniref:BNR repeat-like domain-containing protein n=1 Tax=Micromonospora sediminicola TaxID=946078 RepID=A0A1A9B3C0_9ACTN|nr:hypothetical protein [Micromonospora sediminicola]SBT63623.1 hypothetical protein GA0070622_0578 [Micromonospora sediminicola]
MSDREFSGFEVETIADAVRQPPLHELRAVARSRRRRSAALGSAALALLLAVVVAPVAAHPERFGSPSRPVPSPERVLPGMPGDFTLTGPESGVDVRVEPCVLRFARTIDRGRTWTDWDEARYEADDCGPGSTLEYSVLGDGTYLVRDGLRRLSTDYGRTWQDAERAIIPVRAFPANTRPVHCQFICPAIDEPLAVDPSTGLVYRLSGTPPSPLQLASLYPASDGSIWTTYDPGRGTVAARSTDRGATWKTWSPAAGRSVLALVGVDSQEGYQVVSGPDGEVALERTTDGGTTWSTTGTSLGRGLQWDLTVGADGSLLVVTQSGPEGNRTTKILVSRDDGRSFTTTYDDGMPVASVSVAPGYAWLFSPGGPRGEADHLLLTRDGRTWDRFLLASP